LNVLVGFMSKELMNIGFDSMFNAGLLGCTVGCAAG
jgi:hypothetical protein